MKFFLFFLQRRSSSKNRLRFSLKRDLRTVSIAYFDKIDKNNKINLFKYNSVGVLVSLVTSLFYLFLLPSPPAASSCLALASPPPPSSSSPPCWPKDGDA